MLIPGGYARTAMELNDTGDGTKINADTLLQIQQVPGDKKRSICKALIVNPSDYFTSTTLDMYPDWIYHDSYYFRDGGCARIVVDEIKMPYNVILRRGQEYRVTTVHDPQHPVLGFKDPDQFIACAIEIPMPIGNGIMIEDMKGVEVIPCDFDTILPVHTPAIAETPVLPEQHYFFGELSGSEDDSASNKDPFKQTRPITSVAQINTNNQVKAQNLLVVFSVIAGVIIFIVVMIFVWKYRQNACNERRWYCRSNRQ